MVLRLLAPEPSLDAARAERLLDERTEQLARRGAPVPAVARAAVLACAVGRECYGLPLAALGGVIPAGAPAPVPGAPPALLGLFGRSARLFAVLDLGLLVGAAEPGAPRPETSGTGHWVLLRGGPRGLALRVDRALAAVEVSLLDRGAGTGAVAAHGLAPAGQLGAGETAVAVLDLDRLLRPFRGPLPAAPLSGA
ncbi:chemotaxis protein CheW [Roseomonas sp. BN140053]|uniref:chemotaxis protein CheW n=1 Tax=Roseomonas sp. BN140053 TaxID=3391898 RepID=UPI0039EA6622